MNIILSLKRMAMLVIVILMGANYSFGTVYKLTWVSTTFRKIDNGDKTVHFTYNSSNPASITIVIKIGNRPPKTIEATGVKAQIVDGVYISKEFTLASDSDKGILFTKDGKKVCLLYYDTFQKYIGWTDPGLKLLWPLDWPLESKKGGYAGIGGCHDKNSPSISENERYPDMNVYNAMMAEVERSSSAGSSVQKPAPPATKKPSPATQKPAPDKTPLSANVYNPRYIIKEPGADALFPFQIFYEVKSTRPIERYDFLCLQNADTGQLYNDPTTGSQYYSQSGSSEPLLTLDIEPEQMPAATPAKPIRVRMWIFMSTPGNKEWIGKFSTPVYTWDGTYLRRERK